MVDDHDRVAAAFEELAAWAEDTSPLYERLCREVAADPELLDRYEYDYGGRVTGFAGSQVAIHCELRGEPAPPLPDDPPAITRGWGSTGTRWT